MMSEGYYIHKPGAEKEAVERWENEGGRLGLNYDYIFDSSGREFPGTRTMLSTSEDSVYGMRLAREVVPCF